MVREKERASKREKKSVDITSAYHSRDDGMVTVRRCLIHEIELRRLWKIRVRPRTEDPADKLCVCVERSG